MRNVVWTKLTVVLLLAVLFASYFFTPERVMPSWLHLFMLVIHEAGHILMMPFGEFMMLLGGTFLQIVIPMVIGMYFLVSGQFWSASLSLFLIGFSFLDASIYVADARARALPLITGDKDTHDWWQLLTMLGLLNYDHLLGWLFYLHGLCFYVLAFGCGIMTSKREITMSKVWLHRIMKLARV